MQTITSSINQVIKSMTEDSQTLDEIVTLENNSHIKTTISMVRDQLETLNATLRIINTMKNPEASEVEYLLAAKG